jgi:hypothetical protein
VTAALASFFIARPLRAECNVGVHPPPAAALIRRTTATDHDSGTIAVAAGGPLYVRLHNRGVAASFGVRIARTGAPFLRYHCYTSGLLQPDEDYWLEAKYAGDDLPARDIDVLTGVAGAQLDLSVYEVHSNPGHSPAPQCPGLSDTAWDALMSFRPPSAVQDAAAARAWSFHHIESASGDWLNLDFYTVVVTALPTVDGRALGAEQLLEFLRGHLQLVIAQQLARFSPREPQDEAAWRAGIPGAEMVFSILLPLLPDQQIARPAHVALSEKTDDHWIFSTGRPSTGGPHPVSGNRQFGFTRRQDGALVYYTRGADRPTTALEAVSYQTVFAGGDAIWTQFQDRLADFVNSHGGRATVGPVVAGKYYCWGGISPQHFHPTIPWKT